jgi:hypothetical protein
MDSVLYSGPGSMALKTAAAITHPRHKILIYFKKITPQRSGAMAPGDKRATAFVAPACSHRAQNARCEQD